MSELDPDTRWKREVRLHLFPNTHLAARAIAWFAGGRIMADETATPRVLHLAGEYLGYIFDHMEEKRAEADVLRAAGEPEDSLAVTYTFGNASYAEFLLRMRHLGDAPDSVVPGIREDVERAMELVQGHLADSRALYEEYEEVRGQDPDQTQVS